MNTFEDMAWAYSDSMRADAETDDMATAYAKGFKAGAKAFTAYLKEVYKKSADAGFMFREVQRVFDGHDMYEQPEDLSHDRP